MKLIDIKSTKTAGKFPNTWRLNNILLNNIWAKEKDLKKNFKIFWSKWKWKYSYQNFEMQKAMFSGKFIALNAYIRKEESLKSVI